MILHLCIWICLIKVRLHEKKKYLKSLNFMILISRPWPGESEKNVEKILSYFGNSGEIAEILKIENWKYLKLALCSTF
jgi:hypothetical protein